MTETVKKLSDFQHARTRPNMYLGSPRVAEYTFPILKKGVLTPTPIEYTPALLTAFREGLDNALDELSFVGKGTVRVDYNEAELEFTVSDDGRGIPFEHSDDLGGRVATVALSQTKVGRNFDSRGNVAGQNGLGIAVVNYCSTSFEVQSWREGQHFTQKFEPGENELIIHEPEFGKCGRANHGTQIKFALDRSVFPKGRLPTPIVEALLQMIASTSTHLRVFFNGKRLHAKGDVGHELFKQKVISIEVTNKDDENFKFYVANRPGSESCQMSLVNGIPTINGGEHLHAFLHAFSKRMVEELARESKKRKLNPKWKDVLEECFVFGAARMNAPDFDSQSKTRLINDDMWPRVGDDLWHKVDYKQIIKDNPDFIEALYQRVASRSNAKDMVVVERKAKELRKKKLANLTDATGRDRKACTLALFEGHSAAASYLAVRDSKTQASFPLRGKILACWGKKPVEVMKSEGIDQICAAVGIAPGKPVDPKELRYGQVQIYADADEDGKHIAASLVCLFYQFWPELVDPKWLAEHNNGRPFIVIAKTPIVALKHKKTKKPFYIYQERDFDMTKYPDYTFYGRYKGLGAMSIEDWKAHVNDTKSKVAVVDHDNRLEEMLDLHFSHARADDRKKMLQG